MAEEARFRSGRWTYVGLLAVAAVVFLVVNAASGGAGDPRTPSPSAPPSHDITIMTPLVTVEGTRLAPRTVRGVGPHCERTHCCPTRVRTFGTAAPIARVIAHFQGRGYRYAAPPLVSQGSGDPKTSGTYLRWLGELPGDPVHWRLVNVSTGILAERPMWRTVFQVSHAACEGRPGLPPEDWPRH